MREPQRPGNFDDTNGQSLRSLALVKLRELSSVVLATAPFFPVAVGMLLGVVLDAHHPIPLWAYVCLFLSALLLAAWRASRSLAGMWIVVGAAVAVGGTLHAARARTVPATHIARQATYDEKIVRVVGTIVSEPRILSQPETAFSPWMFGSDRTAFLLRVESMDGPNGPEAATGMIRVVTGDVVLDLREHERIEVLGWLRLFRPPRNPGAYDWASHYERQDIAAGLRCKSARVIHRLDEGTLPNANRGLSWLKRRVRGLLTDDLAAGNQAEATLLEAMILGQRTRLDRYLNDIFVRAGCIHFLAVSGVHVVIVMMLARLVCRMCFGGPRACAWAMLIAVVLYMAIAEPRPSILRAGVIALTYCLSVLLHRSRARLNWVSLSCVVLLVIEPRMLFGVGFQLSYAAVLGVSYLSPALTGAVTAVRPWLRRAVFRRDESCEELDLLESEIDETSAPTRAMRRPQRWVQRSASSAFTISCGAWLAALPIVAWHFGTIHVWGAVNSVLVMPLVTIIMGLGFAKILAGLVWPTLGALAGGALSWVDSGLVGLVEFLAALPGASVTLPRVPWWLGAAYYLTLGCMLVRFRSPLPVNDDRGGDSGNEPRGAGLAASGALATSLAALLIAGAVWLLPGRPGDRLVVTVLSVGNGSAVVIELPDGQTVLCDAGTMGSFDVGTHVVVPYLRHRAIARIDRVHLSHANLDHFSGIPSIVEALPTGPIVVNGEFDRRSHARSAGRRLLELLAAGGHPVEALDPTPREWRLGDVRFEYLYPSMQVPESIPTNDTSGVLRLTYAGRTFMVTGDIETHAQAALIESGDAHADVLVLPHHGGVVSNTAAFLEAVRPAAVIRSSGKTTAETRNGLVRVLGSIPTYNTADVGAVRVEFTTGGVEVFVGADGRPAGVFP